jgi:agmatine/peptidylarginine deiminase
MLNRIYFLMLVTAVLISILCCENIDQQASEQNFSGDPAPFVMLPAYKLPWEGKKSGKADEFDDYRLANPEFYAITKPPAKKFRALREYEDVNALFLAYPSQNYTGGVKDDMVKMAAESAKYVDVYIISKPSSAQKAFTSALKQYGMSQTDIDAKIHYLPFELNAIWMVDFGQFPIIDEANTVSYTDTRYYHERPLDDAIPTKLANYFKCTVYRAPMDYEGGNFYTDGDGSCYASQGVFWENAAMTQEEVKQVYKDYLGCSSLYIVKPLSGEGTTHIDMFYKMIDKHRIVLGEYTQEQDSVNKKVLDDNEAIFKAIVLGDEKGIEIIKVPMPDNTPLQGDTEKVWRTFLNSTFVKPINLWPVYSINTDLKEKALLKWQEAMSDWTHIEVNSDDIIPWGGAMHCISRTTPALPYAKWIADGKCETGKCNAPEGGYKDECAGDEDCYGPEWLCNCNDCTTDCKPPENKCGLITYEGCCTEDGTLKYCENNKIVSNACGAWDKCGWDKNNEYYDCSFSEEGPAGFPKLCPEECGDLTANGKCDGNLLKWCNKGLVEKEDCAAKDMICGEDPANKGKNICKVKCTDECSDGEKGCDETNLKKFLCKKDETSGCFKKEFTDCAENENCNEGECYKLINPDDQSDVSQDTVQSEDVNAETDKKSSGGCSQTGNNTSIVEFMLIMFFLFLSCLRLNFLIK